MKKVSILLAAGLAIALPAFAAKPEKAKSEATTAAAPAQRPGKAAQEFDKNGNHQIDGDEVDALKKQFEADPKGSLARLDHNADGKLDDEEIKALNARLAKHSEGAEHKTGEKKKKS